MSFFCLDSYVTNCASGGAMNFMDVVLSNHDNVQLLCLLGFEAVDESQVLCFSDACYELIAVCLSK